MLKTMRLVSVAAVAALALPALAGSWPPIAPRKAANNEAVAATRPTVVAAGDGFEPIPGEAGWQLVQPRYAYENGKLVRQGNARAAPALAARPAKIVGGFEQVGGEAGWQLAQHKYDLVGGRFAMSDECDHMVRAAQAATPADLERARTFSPGA